MIYLSNFSFFLIKNKLKSAKVRTLPNHFFKPPQTINFVSLSQAEIFSSLTCLVASLLLPSLLPFFYMELKNFTKAADLELASNPEISKAISSNSILQKIQTNTFDIQQIRPIKRLAAAATTSSSSEASNSGSQASQAQSTSFDNQ